jgi:iron complex outermembrane recepter protein
MKRVGQKVAGRILMGVVIGSAGVAARAQQPPAVAPAPASAAAPQEPGSGAKLDVVNVTAQRRSERLQDVPAAITAITGAQIEKSGFDEFADYARTVPGLSFIDRGPGKTKITLRGVSSGVTMDNQSPVGVYFDEMPVSYPSYNPDLRLYDVERIEVLRGPQGTLYGAGSMGGTIKVITRKPELNILEGSVNTVLSRTRFGTDNWRVNAMLNVPVVTDKIALRAVLYKRDEGGFIDNAALGSDNVNRDRTEGLRVGARWVLSPDLEVLGTVFSQRTKLGGTQETDTALGPLRQARQVHELGVDNFDQLNATVNYNLGWAKLLSSTSLFDRHPGANRDISSFVPLGQPVSLNSEYPSKRFSQELRLTSPGGQRWDWIAGAFYLDQKSPLVQHAPVGSPPTMSLLDSVINRDETQKALFGEVNYRFTDKLKGTAGLRWFDVNQSFDLSSSGPIVGGQRTDSGVAAETGLTPKFVLSYQMSPNQMVFAQAAKGFRVGGTNNSLPADPATGQASPTQFKSDSLWSYEAGIKTDLWDRRATLNASVFFIDWTGIQVNIPRSDGFSYTGNAGKATSKGAEVEFAARLTDNFQMSAAMSYTDARLAKDEPGLGGRKGDRIPAVPRVTASLSARYETTIREGLDGFIQGDVQHTGGSYNGFNAATADPQPAYTLANLRAGVMSDAWDLTLFVENLFDKRATLFVDTSLGDKRVNVNRPRTVGVSATYRF